MNKFIYLIFILLFSCAHVPSGHYERISKVYDLESIAKVNNVTIDELKKVNGDKEYKNGDWVFIPYEIGSTTRSESYKQTKASLTNSKFMWPVPAGSKIGSYYGRRWGKKHEGVDIPAPMGSHILASKGGLVIYSGNDLSGYGNMIVIAHGDGLFTVYAHAQKIFVDKNQKIDQGQVIATVGKTGHATGPHLHFEIRHDSKAINPEELLAINP